MRVRWIVITLSLLMFGGANAADYIVKMKGKISTLTAVQGVEIMDTHSVGDLVKVRIPDSNELSVLAEIHENPNVEYVVKDFQLKAFRQPVNIAALRQQWGMVKVQTEKAWKIAGNRGSKNIIVAVIDTGVDYNHESLSPNMVNGYDFHGNDNDPMDETANSSNPFQPGNPGHGTHVAGVVGASGKVDGGIIGVSPEVSIMPLRFLGANGGGDLMNGIKAVDYAIKNGAKIIQASWGAEVSESQAKPLIEAVERAYKAGVVFVAAAGNSSKNNDTAGFYPTNASFPNMISVASSGQSDGKSSFSNFGITKVHVAAPGEKIMSSLPKNKYGNLSGTSMAAPLVSGLVALMMAQDPSLTGFESRAILQQTGAKTAIQIACKCRVDAAAAVEAVVKKTPMLIPYAITMAPNAKQAFRIRNGSGAAKFTISDTKVATVDANGEVTAAAKGETTITVTDAGGNSLQGIIRVGAQSGGSKPGNPGQPGQPGQPGDCPLGNPVICQILCQSQPDLPFCNK